MRSGRTSNRVLLADIGGTNARFALVDGDEIEAIEHLNVADFPDVTEAIATFLQRCVPRGEVGAAVLAVAGPVENNRSARDAPAIAQAALNGGCRVSTAALEMFCSLLGAVAGNLALTFCARGGVYIAGGIVPHFADYLSRSSFRKQFESKGRFESYLRDIPTSTIVRSDESFIGLKAFHDRNMASDAYRTQIRR